MTSLCPAPVRVPGERGHLRHAGVPPDNQLVERIAVSGNELVHIPGPHQIADLKGTWRR